MRMRRVVLAALALCFVSGACHVRASLGLARDCRGANLAVTGIESDGMGGDLIGLRNESSSTCALRQFPTKLTGTSDAGSSEIPIIGRMKSPLVPKAGNLKPRAIGRVVLGPVEQCPPPRPGYETPAPQRYHDLQLFVTGGGAVSLTNLTLDVTCGARATQLGVPR